MAKSTTIRVNTTDFEKMTQDVRKILIEENPELDGMHLSYSYLFHRLIKDFLDEDNQ